ncbi:MAG: DMT family transporter [Gammaproteobacteria bacterium]
MRIGMAYNTIILLWATTPLAIKWSGEGPGFLFGVTARMVIGAVCLLLVLLLSRQRLFWHGKARRTYLAVALQIYGAMTAVYWGAQQIPSGWVSVLFGLTPLMTALLAVIYLDERSLTPAKVSANFMGIAGLAIIFGSAVQLGCQAALGIAAVIIAAFLQSLSAVLIKAIDARLPALQQVSGGLLFALPAFLLTWWIADGSWPAELSATNVVSIVYLGVIATTFGFVLYYYLLTHIAATKVAMITLISPVLALILGNVANHEQLTVKVLAGSLFILSALVLHECADGTFRPQATVTSKKFRG